MGVIYEEFEQQLNKWSDRYAGNPVAEMNRLCLLALEREELVAVAYREELMVKRLKSMPVPQEVRDIVRNALLWVWADEEMHTVYIRGLILKLGSLRLRARAYSHQVAGALGGWASSVRQHVRWGDAPISRALASLIAWSGFLMGQVPREIHERLDYGPLRRFCLLNAETEQTARLCWWRMTELARRDPTISACLIADFRRVQEDEERHGRIFDILAAAFDECDRLAPGESAESLTWKIGEVGPYFIGRRPQGAATAKHPVGAGGKVWVMAGDSGEQKLDLFRRILQDSECAMRIKERAQELGKPLCEMRVAIKPAFMMGYHRKDTSVITDPLLLGELAKYLHEQGCAAVIVIEGRNIYDRFFRNRTVAEVARYFNISSPYYQIVDATTEQVSHEYPRGMAQYSVARTWRDADFRITFGKMKSHPIELAHLTAGNLEWIGARSDEYMFPERQAERETAIVMLLDELPPHFALLDAYDSAADGLVGVMGCPRPKAPRRLYASADTLALDIVAARHLRVKNPLDSSLLRMATKWFGNPAPNTEVIGKDEPLTEWRDPYHNAGSAFLSFFAYPVYVFASGRGSFFVPEMDEDAFPPLNRKWWVRVLRSVTVRLLGLRH